MSIQVRCAYDKIVQIETLKPHPKNRNKHGIYQIRRFVEILKVQGIRRPIRISSLTGRITSGHGLLEALKKAGEKTVPVDIQDYENEDAEYADLTADNALQAWSELDLSAINLDLQDLGPDFNIDLLGIQNFVLEPADKYGDKDADEVPEARRTDIKNGDCWNLGNHRLLCGDSTDAAQVARLMNGEKAAFSFTSPPYSDQRDYSGELELDPKHLAKFLNAPCELFAVNLGIKRSENQIDPYWDIYIEAAKSYGLKLLSWNVWDRGFPFSIRQQTAMFAIEHEWVFVFGKNKKDLNKTIENKHKDVAMAVTNRQKDGSLTAASHTVSSHRRLGTIFRSSVDREVEWNHPAKFPVVFPEAYIKACSNESDAVYEPFGGSGSTLIACEKAKRRAFVTEIDPQYCQLIIDRFEKFTDQKAVKLS